MPFQLVEFKKTPTEDDKDMSTIQIQKESLDKVLEKCGDRPLCIICICGPSRQGKSFILGHIIRCFDATQNGQEDWMGWGDLKRPLDDGFTWQNAYNPVTQGIWIWEKPFILKNSKGKECAVLLIDTQGTYDEFTSGRDMTAIVGLSLLMSSVMIFNFFTNLQEDILESLGTYIEYGLLAVEEKSNEKPFQTLKFLIRDWNNPNEFPYGKDGGLKFINKKLELKPNQPESAQQVRTTITKCFQELSCFLMPAIGSKALAPKYDGNIGALDRTFAKKMEEFITNLVTNELEVKQIVGTEVTAKELRTYMDIYVDTFNSSTIPSAVSIWQATTMVANTSTVEKTQKVYQEEMSKSRRGKGYLNPEAFDAAEKAAKKAALDFYNNAQKYGKNVESFQKTLDEFFEKEKIVLEASNQTKRSTFLKNEEEDAKNLFVEEFSGKYSLENDEEFWEENLIIQEANDKKTTILDDFREKLMDETDEEITLSVNKLEAHFDGIINSIKTRNSLNKMRAEEAMNELVDAGSSKYKTEMNSSIDEKVYEDESIIQKASEDKMEQILTEFESKPQYGDENFRKIFQDKLQGNMDEEWKNVQIKFELKLKELYEKAESLIDRMVDQHDKFLIAQTQDDEITKDTDKTLKHDFENDLAEKIEDFKTKCGFGEDSERRIKLVSKLTNSLNDILQQALERVEEFNRKREEFYKEKIATACKTYGEEMKNKLQAEGFLSEDRIKEEHEATKNKVIATFNEDDDVTIDPSYTEELESMLDKTFVEIELSNQRETEIAIANVRKEIADIQGEYKQKLTDVVDALKLVNGKAPSIQPDHEQAYQEAENRATSICQKFDAAIGEEILNELRSSINSIFDEQQNAIKLKEHEFNSEIRDVLEKARAFYHGEMGKTVTKDICLEPKKLFGISKQIIETAMKDHTSKLSLEHKAELQKALERSFLKYKEENDMKFNSEAKDVAIGIDLGTTYCCVAAYYKGDVRIIKNSMGKNLTPSYIAFRDEDEVIGELAKIGAFRFPENTIFDAKRMIGRKWDDEKLQHDIKFWPFTVINDGGTPKIQVKGKSFHPEQISAKMLKSLKKEAETQLQREIKKVVITVPAYFNDAQRQATVDAGEIAGLEVLEILSEPTAAAIAYKIQRNNDDAKKVLIYDLGGGTFDVAVLEMKYNEIEVLAVDGDTHLGGEDFDKAVMDYCAQEFERQTNIDLFEGKDDQHKPTKDKARAAIRRLQTHSEDRKKDLAASHKTEVQIDNLKEGEDLCVEVTRQQFEELNHDLFEKSLKIVDKALAAANVKKEEIDDIVLVGGSTRILKVQSMLKNHFGGKTLNQSIHPDEAVAFGAAVRAAILNGAEASASINFGTTNIQDVTPMSFGTSVVGGGFSRIIPKGAKVPSVHENKYQTASDNQTAITFDIFQGEDPYAENNLLLGTFRLTQIPPGPRGKEKVDVCMEINKMGILKVTATSQSSGNVNHLVIKADSGRISDEEKKQLIQEEMANNNIRRISHSSDDEFDDQLSNGNKTEDDEDDFESWKY